MSYQHEIYASANVLVQQSAYLNIWLKNENTKLVVLTKNVMLLWNEMHENKLNDNNMSIILGGT